MSLDVSAELVQQAEMDTIDESAFVETIRQSLPYAWGIVETLVKEIEAENLGWSNHAIAPPNEQARGQLLRMVGGDAIRGAVESHFNIKLAFQNCHNLAVFRRDRDTAPAYAEFTSIRSQILNQTPELKDC
ncbi:SCO5389 family protein [Leptolyngbya boryana CZ1]|uniref:SCO5389 family protein n=1 Tax=Leptolyngbya boryana CZ1 TaxID=3060204 RepID=A0AA97ARN3_LEPBY|nr:SCO5389 family protein [Leptolyngbya boryana]WNZ48773.1 SCO5389 family protein [Leptolyngbya boryana CZ1]